MVATIEFPTYKKPKAGEPQRTVGFQQGLPTFGMPQQDNTLAAPVGRQASMTPQFTGALTQALGMDAKTGDLAANSVLRGPQNAYTPEMTEGFQAQARQALQQRDQSAMSGAATAAAARGVAGLNPGAIMSGMLDSQQRGDIAKLGLDVNLAGEELGIKKHASQLAGANTAAGLYQTERGYDEKDYGAQMQAAQNRYQQALSTYNNYKTQNAEKLAAKSGGTKDEAQLANYRLTEQQLKAELEAAMADMNKFMTVGGGMTQAAPLDVYFPTSGPAYDKAYQDFLKQSQTKGGMIFPDYLAQFFQGINK